MNVSLTPQLEEWIAAKIREGKYQTASEAVRDGLRALADREEERQLKLEWLRREVKIGIDEMERGEVSTMTMEEIKTEARRRFAEKKKRVG